MNLKGATMFSLAKILVPIDFSERCLGAARYAISLVEHFQSELTLLHVVSTVDDLSPEAAALNAERRVKAQKALDDFLCAALNHLNTRRILREGDPAEVIVDQAQNDRSDLIMMPTHGFGPIRRFLLGSVTAKVLHDAPCPVWTGAQLAQGPPREWLALARIVCSLDLGPHSASTLRWASSLAAAYKSDLKVLHVVEQLDPAGSETYDTRGWRRQLIDRASESLAVLQQNEGTHWDPVIEPGNIAEAIATAAVGLDADLIIIGRRGTSDRPLGTHAYEIIRRSPRPVVSI